MATLIRQDVRHDDLSQFTTSFDISRGVPRPFPSVAEREQEELLESLAAEELHLDEAVSSYSEGATPHDNSTMLSHALGVHHIPPGDYTGDPDTALSQDRFEDISPSIAHVQTACLTALNHILAASTLFNMSNPSQNATLPDRRHSLPPSVLSPSPSGITIKGAHHVSLPKIVRNLRARSGDVNGATNMETTSEAQLLEELYARVQSITDELPQRDAALSRTLSSLLLHLNSVHPSHAPAPAQARVVSWSEPKSPETLPADAFATLRRQVSDFRLERSHSGDERIPESVSLWAQIDAELEVILALCRRPRSTDAEETSPPEYDPGDYEHHQEYDGLPRYEPASDEGASVPYKAEGLLNEKPRRISDGLVSRGVSEKMKMDLEAVTLAIDRLYLVAPQLHNQRVELKQSKLDQMERARRKGKQKEDIADVEVKELNRILEMVGKAVERKLVNQSFVLDPSALKERIDRAKQEDNKKRTAFVEHLARHSDAGRLHSQEAVFLSPTARLAQQTLSTRTSDPCALLSLPEFIREGIPGHIQRQIELRGDAEALLTLPEFIKRYPRPESLRPHGQAVDHCSTEPGTPAPSSVTRPVKRLRSASEPLAWLWSGSSSRSSSPGSTGPSILRKHRSSKLARQASSGGLIPIVHEGLNVTYVAEYHENLQHVLAFLTVSGEVQELEAEVVPASVGSMDERDMLILRSGPCTSPPLSLPAAVHRGKADLVLSGQHYQVKLPSTPFADSPTGSDFLTEFLDAAHFQAISPTSFICVSCSLPLVHAARLARYRDLPSEHWAELVDAWMCHSDMKLHEHVKNGSRDGFWPGDGETLVGGSYVLLRGNAVVTANVCEVENAAKSPFDDWARIRCICGALLGRSQQHPTEEGCTVYRLAKYAFRPISPTAEPIRVPLSAFIVEDMNEYVHAHATYRFVILDEEEELPRILIWLFKPNMRLAYTTPSQYVIPKSGTVRAAKVLFKILGPTMATELPNILEKYPGFPQAEHLFYPRDVCRRLAAVLKESNTAYPENMRTMTGLDVGWLERA